MTYAGIAWLYKEYLSMTQYNENDEKLKMNENAIIYINIGQKRKLYRSLILKGLKNCLWKRITNKGENGSKKKFCIYLNNLL